VCESEVVEEIQRVQIQETAAEQQMSPPFSKLAL
jgi:hypothetical protein